ncbi:MAG TPA: mechanosensitive ion channel [Lutibacter sp.]|nr:mechanosensitive ion channel [Lutibacter sp.]
MEKYLSTLPIEQILLYLVIGALLHFVFHVISKYIIPVLLRKESTVALLWQRLQIVVWVVFFVFLLSSLLVANHVLTLAIGFIVLVTGWSSWTNFFAGASIKFSNTPRLNDYIVTDLVAGRIKNINLTSTEIINKKGELIVIPNSKLNKLVIKYINDAKSLNPFVYNYISKKEVLYDKLYERAINCPYFTANQAVKIERGTGNAFQINAMLIDESLREKAIDYLEK